MCKSVRGAAYFGSSIHLAFSFIFLFWFVFDTLISEININLWRCDPPEQKFSDVDPIAHYFNLLFKLLYFTGLCVTGVYIFRGVERERPQLLKFATLAFIILQIVGVILFSVFFSIQWNAEPEDPPASIANIEAAQLIAEEPSPLGELPASPSIPSDITNDTKCNNMALMISDTNDNDLNNADEGEKSMDNLLKAVTPIVSENVLAAPDINETTATTTTPIPPLKDDVLLIPTTATPTTTTTLSTTQAPVIPPPSCTTPDCTDSRSPAKPQARRLPHNQLVRLVLQMCFAITNGLTSVAYVIVLALYMLKL